MESQKGDVAIGKDSIIVIRLDKIITVMEDIHSFGSEERIKLKDRAGSFELQAWVNNAKTGQICTLVAVCSNTNESFSSKKRYSEKNVIMIVPEALKAKTSRDDGLCSLGLSQ